MGQALYAPFPNPVYLTKVYTGLSWSSSSGRGFASINIPGVGTGTPVSVIITSIGPDIGEGSDLFLAVIQAGCTPNTLNIRTNQFVNNAPLLSISVTIFFPL
jgi:hypothetical protein